VRSPTRKPLMAKPSVLPSVVPSGPPPKRHHPLVRKPGRRVSGGNSHPPRADVVRVLRDEIRGLLSRVRYEVETAVPGGDDGDALGWVGVCVLENVKGRLQWVLSQLRGL
jgi:hypothetical protein